MTNRFSFVLAGALLLGHLALLSSRTDTAGSPLERAILAVFAPVGHLASRSVDTVRGALDDFRRASTLERQNRELRERLDRLEAEVTRLHGIEEEFDRLARMASYDRPRGGISVADVVYVDRGSWLRGLVLYVGATPASTQQPVVTDLGLVGRIILTGGRYAKVQLITDRASAVSAMIARTRRKGLIRGVGPEELALDHIPIQADVRVGDEIVTAGLDGVYPRGIPIGTVVAVEPGRGLFHGIRVRPALDPGRLDQVYVLDRETVPSQMREGWDRPGSDG